MPAVKKARDKSPIDGRWVEQDGVRRVSLVRGTATSSQADVSPSPTDMYGRYVCVSAAAARARGVVDNRVPFARTGQYTSSPASSPSMILQRSQVTMRLSCLDLGSGAPLVHLRVGRPIAEEEASTAAPMLCCRLSTWTKGTWAGAKASSHERSRLLGQGSEQVPRLAVQKLAMEDLVDYWLWSDVEGV